MWPKLQVSNLSWLGLGESLMTNTGVFGTVKSHKSGLVNHKKSLLGETRRLRTMGFILYRRQNSAGPTTSH